MFSRLVSMSRGIAVLKGALAKSCKANIGKCCGSSRGFAPIYKKKKKVKRLLLQPARAIPLHKVRGISTVFQSTPVMWHWGYGMATAAALQQRVSVKEPTVHLKPIYFIYLDIFFCQKLVVDGQGSYKVVG